MSEKLKEIILRWNVKGDCLTQKYPSVWEVDHAYMIKVYDDKEQLHRNVKILSQLLACGLPVAEIVFTSNGQAFVTEDDKYYLMTRKLQGSNIADIHDIKIAYQMGAVIGRLHEAFLKCEKGMSFGNNSLLEEMKGWILKNLRENEWTLISESEYLDTVQILEVCYDSLPIQLIHRDVHFGNFLFSEGNFSGYIDFDLSQRNIRIFDICYFLTGLLTQESGWRLHADTWLHIVKSVVDGYDSIQKLHPVEKAALPCVMKCIEILFVAYFISIDDLRCAKDAAEVFHYVQACENEIKNAVCKSHKGI